MKRHLLLKTMLLLCALVVGTSSSWAQSPTTFFSETFGDNGSSNTVYGSYTGYSATSAMFTTGTASSNYTGNGKVGKNSVDVSTGYSGASGNSAVWRQASTGTNTVDFLVIDNINITGYTSLSLSFGAYMTNGASSSNKIIVKYKIDNGEEQTMTVSNLPTAITAWRLASGTISGTGNKLKLTFQHKTTGGYTYRLDDIKISGTATTPSSAVTFGTKTPSISYPDTKTYSQEPTTADGYSGTITYSITANTAGATINSETGVVSVTKRGSVTVKAEAEATAGYLSSNDSYTLTVNDTRAESGLAWSAASASVTYNDTPYNFPSLSNTHSLPVTYESSNTDVATISNEGDITLKNVTGSTTISAIFAGDETYQDETVSYTLNVTMCIVDGVFDFVNAGLAEPLIDYGSGMILNDNYTNTAKTWTAGNVKMVTARVSGNGYRWYTSDKTLRFYNKSTATFSVPSGYVITKIETTGASFDSSTPSGLSGSTWTGASNEVVLTATNGHNIKAITVSYTTANQTFTPGKTYTTLTSAYALDFTTVSDDLKAFIAKDGVSEGSVKMTQVNKVPANTGLVLKATTPNSAVNVPVFDGTGADDVTGNKMVGSATETTAIEKDGGYILSNGVFQPASAGTLAAGKAYLQIAVTSARSLEMSFDDATTAINGIEEVAPVNVKTRKVVKNGRLVIETANGEFTIDGARMK